jgi:hypothetical protein
LFHRYSSKLNKGVMPSASRQPEIPGAAEEEEENREATPERTEAHVPQNKAEAAAPPAGKSADGGDTELAAAAAVVDRGKGITAAGSQPKGEASEPGSSPSIAVTKVDQEAKEHEVDGLKAAERDARAERESLKQEAADALELFGGHGLGPGIWSREHLSELCCCQYRSLGVMEM